MKFNKFSKYLLFSLMLSISLTSIAQNKKKRSKRGKPAISVDTVKRISPRVRIDPKKKIKPYTAVINRNFKTHKGLFTVHRFKDTTYFEIPDTLLKRDIMLINRLSKSPAGFGLYAGEKLDQNTIHFEKGPDSSIRIRYTLLLNEADSSSAIAGAVLRSNLSPIAISFPIVAYAKDSSSCVINVSKFLTEASLVNTTIGGSKVGTSLKMTTVKDVILESVRTYPINVELTISKTVPGREGTPPTTLETNSSFILLPKVPMQRRYFDKRVGYFGTHYNAFSDSQHRAEAKTFISRWRLEPKDADLEKWKKGVLVEPKQPIVIYIDPATPKQWVPYLIKGINDWQTAFEQAGFKHAIVGKAWPENDPDMHLGDARYSMINYLPSNIANAYGPHVADPRSGEIIQTQIGWYHNVMDLLNRWYLVQASATDPAARKGKFDDELMGQLIRFVSSHEVGHTLGLRHNFGSSSKTPVDSLRNIHYLKKYGHTASIMDYARFNYVAQPEDRIPQELLFPRIGDYDKWAIEWGYKNSFAKNAEEDSKVVKQWIVNRLGKNPRLWFGDGETQKGDPRVQTEDLGDNSMKASIYGIKNLKRILPNLKSWTYEKGGLYENMSRAHNALFQQYYRYLNHVLRNVGGIYRTYRSEDEKLPVYTVVSRKTQLEAIHFFDKELFTTPKWLLNGKIWDRDTDPVIDASKNPAGMNFVEDMQVKTLNSLLDLDILIQISANSIRFGKGTYTVTEHLAAVRNCIWKDLNAPSIQMDSYRRNLQKTYLGALVHTMATNDPAKSETDVSSVLRAEIKILEASIKRAIPKAKGRLDRYHLLDLESRINKLLYAKAS